MTLPGKSDASWQHKLTEVTSGKGSKQTSRSHPYQTIGSDTSQEDLVESQTRSVPSYHPIHTNVLRDSSPTKVSQSRLSKRDLSFRTFNLLAPLAICALYIIIIVRYLLRSSDNGVVPHHIVDPRTMFFIWLILGIFLLDWAKTASASVERAIILNYPSLAPSSVVKLTWHFDRGWASLSTWWRLACHAYRCLVPGRRHGHCTNWHGPGGLWWFLSLTYLLFAVMVPLGGLSMDLAQASRLGSNSVIILGVNETTFDVRTNVAVSELARNNWKTGNPATPEAPAIFYAPEHTQNASATYFEDAAQKVYQHDLMFPGNQTNVRQIDFFSGPPVATRAHGRVWGVRNIVSCSTTSLDARDDNGLKLLNVSGPNNWNATKYFDESSLWNENDSGGVPVFAYSYSNAFGNAFTYLVASDRDISGVGTGDYVDSNGSTTSGGPVEGSLEMAIWQSIPEGFEPDASFQNMSTHPLVTTSDNGVTLGYGLRCEVTSDVGFATLDAVKRTFGTFEHTNAQWGARSVGAVGGAAVPIYQYPGVFAIQSLVFQALSTVSLGYVGAPSCSNNTADSTCSAFYSANTATGGVPRIASVGNNGYGQALQLPSITPARMTLAMYKLFGETAAAMMAIGPGNWTKPDFDALEPANDLVPGRVSWILVLILLSIWTVLAFVPQLLLIKESRLSGSLEEYATKKYGADWRDGLPRL